MGDGASPRHARGKPSPEIETSGALGTWPARRDAQAGRGAKELSILDEGVLWAF